MCGGCQPLPSLLQLPDACLLAVLYCCADDPASMFSAARAHSRLHQAAVLAASSIRFVGSDQQQLDSVLLYLTNHAQNISSVEFETDEELTLQGLPIDKLHGLSSLSCSGLDLQLQPGGGFQGVLGPGLQLQQLQLQDFILLDGEEGLAAALPALPRLQHLSITHCECVFDFPSEALQDLQQLTYLELVLFELQDPDGLRHLQGLTRLQDLRLSCGVVQPDALAGRTALQHLELRACSIQGGAAGIAVLLSCLQQLQQLTHLSLHCSLEDTAPAAAYSALTASSNLQHLDVSYSTLPAGVWQLAFPAGRRLPHLRVLDVGHIHTPEGPPAAAPEGSRLVTCCPGLQSLQLRKLQCSIVLLAPLTGLTNLHELVLCPADRYSEGLEVVCQLTGLRRLHVADFQPDGLLMHLSQLRQLTHLEYLSYSYMDGGFYTVQCKVQAPDDEPVWRQVIRHHLNHSDPAIAQHAAAALAETGTK